MSAHATALPRRRTPRAGLARSLRFAERASNVVCLLALALLAVVLLGSAAGYRGLVEHSGSMSPAIDAGDMLVVRETPALSIRPGEIVTFRDPALQGRLVTHRVISVRAVPGRLQFLTRGDANAAPESWSVPRLATVGLLSARIALLGRATAWMTGGLGRTVVLSLLALVLGGELLRRIWRA